MSLTELVGYDLEQDGLHTRVIDEGNGSPLLLLHGSGAGVSTLSNWSKNIPALAEKHRVIAPDLYGFGESSRTPGHRYGLEVWSSQVRGLLDSLEIEKTTIVGNSLGAWLAMDLAVNFPDRVSSLILMGSAGTKPLTKMINQHVSYTPSKEGMRSLLEDFAFNPEHVTDWLVEERFNRSNAPGAQDAYIGTCTARDDDAQHRLVDPARLAALALPTLIIHGKEDRVIPAQYSWELAQALPTASLHVFGQCGHWPQIEHSEQFNRLLLDYVRDWGL
jgi:2-hydroxymuconate-semialdehyde hydrolase